MGPATVLTAASAAPDQPAARARRPGQGPCVGIQPRRGARPEAAAGILPESSWWRSGIARCPVVRESHTQSELAERAGPGGPP